MKIKIRRSSLKRRRHSGFRARQKRLHGRSIVARQRRRKSKK